MKKTVLLILTIVGTLLNSLESEDILKKADEAFKGENIYSKTVITITRNGKKLPVQEIEGYSTTYNGETLSLSIYNSPKKMKGNANLMIGDGLWVKFASTGRVRKLSSSAKKNSSGGSDFSYADMGSGSEGISNRYNSKLLGEESIKGIKCYKIELQPTADNDSGYDKLIVYIDKEEHRYLFIEYYKDGGNIKSLTLGDYEDVDGLVYPMVMTMKSNIKDSETRIETVEIEVNSQKVKKSYFTQAYLKKIK